MAKQLTKEKLTPKKNIRRTDILVLEPINYKIIAAGLAVILLGYFALTASPWDNPVAITVAPILLMLGYCVIVPIGIIYRGKKNVTADAPAAGEPSA
jgi:hypothetical protein